MSRRDAEAAAVQRLTDSEVQFVLRGITQSAELHQFAVSQLRPTDFTPSETVVCAVYTAIVYSRHTYGAVTYDLLAQCTQQALTHASVTLPENMANSLFDSHSGFLRWLLLPLETAELRRAAELLQRFVQERCVVDRMLRTLQQTPQGYISGTVVESVRQMSDTALATQRDPLHAAGQIVWSFNDMLAAPPTVRKQLTGCWYIDDVTGGAAPHEPHGLLGLTGTGKSSMAADLIMRQVIGESAKPAGQRSLHVYVTYEQTAPQLRSNFLSAGACIRTSVAEQIANGDMSHATRRGQLVDFDAEACQMLWPGTEEVVGELERFEVIRPWIQDYFVLLDMSFAAKSTSDYTVAGLARVLEQVRDQRGLPIKTVVVDYAGAACEARGMIEQTRHDPSSTLALYLKQYGKECLEHICAPLQTTVWALHQINPAVTNAVPGRLFHHTEAHYSRAYAEHLAYCGCLGVPNKQKILTLNWSKHRHGLAQADSFTLVRRHPLMLRFVEASGYRLQKTGGNRMSIVDQAIEARMGAQAATLMSRRGGAWQNAVSEAVPPVRRGIGQPPAGADAL